MKKIVVVGSANIDLVIRTRRLPGAGETVMGNDVVTAFGGKGANEAVAAARLGAPVEFVGCMGADAFGVSYLQRMAEEGIGTSCVRRDEQRPNGCAMILVDDNGENVIVVSPGSNMALTPADIDAAASVIAEADAVVMQFEIPMVCVERAMEIANHAGVPVIVNPSPVNADFRVGAFGIDFLICNEHEARFMAGAHTQNPARELLAKGIRNVIVTRGAKPTVVVSPEGDMEVPGFKVQPVDTVGAGDTFAGAFAVALAEGRALTDAVRFANGAAALATTHLGAQSSMPTREELDKFMAAAK